MDALVEQLRPAFTPSCLTATLDVSPSKPGGTTRHVAEIEGTPTGTCDCASLGRNDPAPTVAAAAHQHLLARGLCADDGSATSCDLFCVCEIPGVEDAALTRCQAGDALTRRPGLLHRPRVRAAPTSAKECAPGFERSVRGFSCRRRHRPKRLRSSRSAISPPLRVGNGRLRLNRPWNEPNGLEPSSS